MSKRLLTLKDCTTYVKNGATIAQIPNCNEGIPFTRIETISNCEFNRDKMGYAKIMKIGKYEKNLLEDKDLLFSYTNSEKLVGNTVVYNRKGKEKIIHGKNLLCIRASSDIIDPDYLACYINSKYAKQFISKYSKKSVNQVSITINDLLNMPIVVYDKQTQLDILKDLNNINKVLSKLNKLKSLLYELVKSRFLEIFGDPVTNTLNWKTEKFSDVVHVNDCYNYYGRLNEIWLLNLDKIEPNTGRILGKEYFKKEELTSQYNTFDANCVLYSKLRPYLNKVALPDEIGYATRELLVFSMTKKVNKIFLAELLRSDSFVLFANSTSDGAKMPRASAKKIKEFPLICPPLELQEEFEEFVHLVDKTREVVEKQITAYEEFLDEKINLYFEN